MPEVTEGRIHHRSPFAVRRSPFAVRGLPAGRLRGSKALTIALTPNYNRPSPLSFVFSVPLW